MIVVRENTPSSWCKVDKKVFANPNITDGAVRLYGYLIGLQSGRNFTDAYLVKALGISNRTLANRKRELSVQGLIKVKQVAPRLYMLFIGSTQRPAESVYLNWRKESDLDSLAQISEVTEKDVA